MTLHEYISNLKRANGLQQAQKIAKRCMDATDPSDSGDLPNGPVFYYKDKRGANTLNMGHLKKLHNFWREVFFILRKMKA